jgi:hypothetical protein
MLFLDSLANSIFHNRRTLKPAFRIHTIIKLKTILTEERLNDCIVRTS